MSNGLNGGLASNYTLNGGEQHITINKKPIKLSGSRKINRINRNVRLSSGQLRMENLIEGDDLRLTGATKVRSIREGLNKITSTGLKLSGGDASNYTLLGETHEFTFELRAKFKALKNIENKINELAKSGKKIITGATQAVPKVVVMTTTPTAAPAAGGPPSSGAPATSGGGVSSGSSGGSDGGSGDSPAEE